MKWGASDGEQSNRSPAMATLVFRNHEGRYSPLNPESDLYGYLGRDTEIRVTVDNTRRFQGWANTWQPKWGNSRSEERRVGKEGRARRPPCAWQKTQHRD